MIAVKRLDKETSSRLQHARMQINMKIGFRFLRRYRGYRSTKSYRTAALAATALVVAVTSFGQRSFADVENVRWIGEGHEQGFQIEFEGDGQHHVETLDDGRRVRIVLEGVELKKDVTDIVGRGRTVGVFPFAASGDDNVYIDVLLDAPGNIVVEKNDKGLMVYPPDSAVAMQVENEPTVDMATKAASTDTVVSPIPAVIEASDKTHSDPVVDSADDQKDAKDTQAQEIAAKGADSEKIPPVQPPVVDDTIAANAVLPTTDTVLPIGRHSGAETDKDTDQSTSTAADVRRQSVVLESKPDTEQANQSTSVSNTDSGETEQIQEVAESAPLPPVSDTDGEAESQTALRAGDADDEIVVAAADVVTSAASTMREAAVTMVAANTTGAVGEELGLTGIRFSPLSGGRVQVDVQTDSRAAEPGTFATNKPPRLALDFFGARIGFEDRNIKVGAGALESIIAIQTKDRVRLVLNLVRTVGYETIITDTGVSIVLDAPASSGVSSGSLQSRMFPEQSDKDPRHSISKVDFRRDKDGGGRIIVELSDPKAGVDVKEKAGELVVDFIDTGLPAELERRLDVVDFATPVQTIDTFRQGDHTRMVITPSGRYRQLAYQSGNVFSLTVSPLTAQELEEETKDEFGYSGEKLSLNFQKISVRAALQVIADFTGLNFVTSDSVKGSLTLRLQDVPWDQALDIVLQTKGLAMRQKGNVVWVAPATEIAAKERQQLEASRQVAELEPLASELIQINYAKAEDIADLLKSIEPVQTGVETGAFGSVSVENVETESNTLLSPRGQVTIDNRTNSLLIQDTPSKIREIRKLISKLDRPVRQVLIETRIVEASDNFSRVLGARLGYARQSENTRFPGSRGSNLGTVTMSGNVEDLTTINNEGFTTTNNDGLAVNLPARGIGGETAGSFAISVEKVASGMWNLLNLELSALEASGDGKIIASPKIMTANQQQAIIKQGQERVFPPSGFNTKPTRDEAVLLLQVKPQITPDDRLVLDVRIKQDVFVDTTINVKDKKEVETQVLLENGETVVIGGIYQEQNRQDLSKIPLLGDIPLLGNLFKRKGRTEGRQELLVFLTPRILDNTISLR